MLNLKGRPMLNVYWLVHMKKIHAFSITSAFNVFTSRDCFWNNAYISIFIQHSDILMKQCFNCWWGMQIYNNEDILAGNSYVDARYSDAEPDAT